VNHLLSNIQRKLVEDGLHPDYNPSDKQLKDVIYDVVTEKLREVSGNAHRFYTFNLVIDLEDLSVLENNASFQELIQKGLIKKTSFGQDSSLAPLSSSGTERGWQGSDASLQSFLPDTRLFDVERLNVVLDLSRHRMDLQEMKQSFWFWAMNVKHARREKCNILKDSMRARRHFMSWKNACRNCTHLQRMVAWKYSYLCSNLLNLVLQKDCISMHIQRKRKETLSKSYIFRLGNRFTLQPTIKTWRERIIYTKRFISAASRMYARVLLGLKTKFLLIWKQIRVGRDQSQSDSSLLLECSLPTELCTSLKLVGRTRRLLLKVFYGWKNKAETEKTFFRYGYVLIMRRLQRRFHLILAQWFDHVNSLRLCNAKVYRMHESRNRKYLKESLVAWIVSSGFERKFFTRHQRILLTHVKHRIIASWFYLVKSRRYIRRTHFLLCSRVAEMLLQDTLRAWREHVHRQHKILARSMMHDVLVAQKWLHVWQHVVHAKTEMMLLEAQYSNFFSIKMLKGIFHKWKMLSLLNRTTRKAQVQTYLNSKSHHTSTSTFRSWKQLGLISKHKTIRLAKLQERHLTGRMRSALQGWKGSCVRDGESSLMALKLHLVVSSAQTEDDLLESLLALIKERMLSNGIPRESVLLVRVLSQDCVYVISLSGLDEQGRQAMSSMVEHLNHQTGEWSSMQTSGAVESAELTFLDLRGILKLIVVEFEHREREVSNLSQEIQKLRNDADVFDKLAIDREFAALEVAEKRMMSIKKLVTALVRRTTMFRCWRDFILSLRRESWRV